MKRFELIRPLKKERKVESYLGYFQVDERDFVKDLKKGRAWQFAREQNISKGVSQVVAQHLEFFTVPKLKAKMAVYLDRAIDYFYGDWWASHEDREYLDKSLPAKKRNLIWTQPLLNGLLLGALLERWDDVTHLCNWVDESVTTEFRFELSDDALDAFLLLLASNLRDEPASDEQKIRKFIARSKSKNARLLLAVLEAALAGDQASFSKALRSALVYAEQHTIEDVATIRYWAAIPESLLWLIAERNGLKLPKLPDYLDALLVRRETVLPKSRKS